MHRISEGSMEQADSYTKHEHRFVTPTAGRTAPHWGESGRACGIATQENSQRFHKLATSEYSIADTTLVRHTSRSKRSCLNRRSTDTKNLPFPGLQFRCPRNGRQFTQLATL